MYVDFCMHICKYHVYIYLFPLRWRMRSDPKRSKVKAEEMAKADTASVLKYFTLDPGLYLVGAFLSCSHFLVDAEIYFLCRKLDDSLSFTKSHSGCSI